MNRKILSEYDENYGSCGLDEAFVDLTSHFQQRIHSPDQQRTFPKDVNKNEHEETITFGLTAEETVQEIRHRIYLATHLTASAGIACNMRLAKLCSGRIFFLLLLHAHIIRSLDINKPNGQYRLESNVDVILNFIRNLPIRKVKNMCD